MLVHPSSGARDLFVELFRGLYCSGSMCVGVTVWFGWGGVVSLCRLKLCFNLHNDTTIFLDTTPQFRAMMLGIHVYVYIGYMVIDTQ